MNRKFQFIFAVSALLLLFVSCQNDVNYLGGSVQPEDDRVTIKVDTFNVESRTFKVDSVYARTPNGLLGIIDDPAFGALTSDYMTEFYVPEDFYFHDNIIDDKIDSVILRITYGSYTGDSLNPMELSVYELDKPLERNYYSNVVPEDYYDSSKKPLCKTFYTAVNATISDSIMNSVGSYLIDCRLPDSMVDRVLTNTVPSIYVKNTFGRGTMLNVSSTYMVFYFKYNLTLKDKDDEDSVVVRNGMRVLSSTKEVIQLNRAKTEISDDYILDNDTSTFLRTPNGLFTEVTLPVERIKELYAGKTINSIKFNVPAFKPYISKYAKVPPRYLLLVQKSKINHFFESNSLPDNKNSFIATLDSTAATGSSSAYMYQYNFKNIAVYISNLIKENTLEEGCQVALVPVAVDVDQTTGAVTRLKSLLYPSSIELKKNVDRARVSVVYTEF